MLSTQQLLLIAAAALLVFWVLGAHNRMVALRNAIGAAWAQVDEPLQRRGAALSALTDGLRALTGAASGGALRDAPSGQPGGLMPDEHGALDAVQAAQAQLQAAADALRARPALAPRAAKLADAEAVLADALSRLLALLEQRDQLAAADDHLAPHLATLHDAGQRLVFARQLFNDAVRSYNEAAQQFPTRIVARLFGFGAAGVL